MLIIWHEVDSIPSVRRRKTSSVLLRASRAQTNFGEEFFSPLQLLNSGVLIKSFTWGWTPALRCHCEWEISVEVETTQPENFSIPTLLAERKVHALVWNVYCVKNYIYLTKVRGGWKLLNSAFCYCDVITFHYFYLRYHFGVFFSVFVFRYRDETTRCACGRKM